MGAWLAGGLGQAPAVRLAGRSGRPSHAAAKLLTLSRALVYIARCDFASSEEARALCSGLSALGPLTALVHAGALSLHCPSVSFCGQL